MKIRCMIVDDEPVAHKVLEEYLSETPEIEITGKFFNAIDARRFLEQHKADLLFLDIKMPEEDGLSFLKGLDEKPVTILVTAMLEHALEAYDLDVVDYLVKPIRPERFQKALNKAIDFLRSKQQQSVSDSVKPGKGHITIKSGKKTAQVAIDAISHVQALKDYMLIYASGTRYIVRSTVTKMLDMLPPGQFARVHKSFIVNKAMIKRVATNRIELDGFTIPFGKHFRQSLE
jgi:DNA-binding LytR/AlgR family response regulator